MMPASARPLLVIGATELELAPLLERMAGSAPVGGPWTPARLGRLGGVAVVVQALGLGKVRTAAGLACAVARHRPAAVLQVGIGGAYLGSFLSVGLAMLADVDLELDLGVATGEGWADPSLLAVPLMPLPSPAHGGSASADAPAGAPADAREAATHPALTTILAELTGLPRGRFATLDTVTADVDTGAALQRRFDVAIESMEGAAAAVVAARLGVPFAELRAVSNVVGERDHRRWDLRGAVRVAASTAARALGDLADHPAWAAIARDTAET